MEFRAGLDAVEIATAVLNIGAFFGSVAVAIFALKKRQSDGVPSKVWRWGAATSYLLYASPNYPSAFQSSPAWPTIMNDIITGLAILKTAADNTEKLAGKPQWNDMNSGFAESAINFVWLVPACYGIYYTKDPKDSDWCALGANLGFDIGGVLHMRLIKQSLVQWPLRSFSQ